MAERTVLGWGADLVRAPTSLKNAMAGRTSRPPVNPIGASVTPHPGLPMTSERPRRPTVVLFGSYGPSLINFRGPLVEALVQRGARVVAMAPDIDPKTAARLVELGAEPLALDLVNSSLNPFKALRSVAELSRIFRALEPDVLIAYTIKPVTLGALAAHRAGVPNITAMITGLGYAFTWGWEPKRVISKLVATVLYKLAIFRCTSVIFQNPDDRDYFRSKGLLRGQAKVTVVDGSGIDLDHYAVRPLPESVTFLMMARLLKDKGVREYAAAAAALKIRHPGVSFRLAGYFDPSPDSISRAELDALIAGGVEYLGQQSDVREALSQASVCVLPSYYREGTPRSVLEAMAMGRAIITTDAPGCRETVIEGVNGFLVPVRDAVALAKAMERLIAEPSLAGPMGAASRRYAEDRYDVRKVNAAVIASLGLG